MSPAAISRRTWMVAAVGVALVAGAAISITSKATGEFADIAVSDLVETLIGFAAGAFVLWAASRFGKGEPVRRQWGLIGGGVLAFAVGDLVWTVYEVFMRVEPPYPGVPDIFYVIEYGLLGAGVLLAALAYRRLMDVRLPVALAAGISVALCVFLWVRWLGPIAADASVSVGERVLSVFYPLGDVLLELLPVLFIIFVAMRLRGGRLSWPWWAVAIGIVVMAVSDTAYSYLSSIDKYQSGMIIDYGWMAGLALCAIGASLALDVLGPRRPVPVKE